MIECNYEFDQFELEMLKEVAGLYAVPEGAYNFRVNGKAVGRNSSANIDVDSREDGKGLKITIKPGTKNESVHIPVIISKTGHKEDVYNDFYIGDDSDVLIIAGCGIYNCGGQDSVHNGIHRFFVGKNAKVKYVEKHYGMGQARGGKILNPTTEVFAGEGSEVEMDLEQIKGVDDTKRVTKGELCDNSKLIVRERIMTHGRQTANSDINVELKGKESTVDIVSRAVAQDMSKQNFKLNIIGDNKCRGHSECDAIIMDKARVNAIPSLDARSVDAELIHEAAIGKIAGEQIDKLMTLGLTQAEAESKIINGFLK